MAENTVKIVLITGYLGAGKTTLLNHILGNDRGVRAAVIVNDIGEVNVDAALIEKAGVVTQVDNTLVPLSNGCICCTLADDLARQLTDLAESGKFDYIIIEASGICEPIPIAFTIDNFCKEQAERGTNIVLDNIVAVVDCARMYDEFNGGKALVKDDIDEEDIESLLVQQIEFCTTLLLNKTDCVTPEQVDELKALVRSLQKEAKIVECVQGEVDLDELLDTGRFDFDRAYGSAAWIEAMEHPEEHEDPEVLEYEIETFVYQRRAPFSMAKPSWRSSRRTGQTRSSAPRAWSGSRTTTTWPTSSSNPATRSACRRTACSSPALPRKPSARSSSRTPRSWTSGIPRWATVRPRSSSSAVTWTATRSSPAWTPA